MRKPNVPTLIKRIVVIVAVTVGLLQLFAAVGIYFAMKGQLTPITTLAQLKSNLPLTLPSDTVLVSGYDKTGIRELWEAVFKFKKSEAQLFLNQKMLKGYGSTDERQMLDFADNSVSAFDKNYRNIASIRKHVDFDNLCPSNDANNQIYILVDLDDPQYATVYVINPKW